MTDPKQCRRSESSIVTAYGSGRADGNRYNQGGIIYRGHKIIAATIKGVPTAAVYLGKSAATPDRFHGEVIVVAVDLAKRWVDSKYDEAAATRAAPHVATVQEYVIALQARPLKDNELATLKSHARHGTLTATQLADAAGYTSYEGANVHYGGLGRAISEILHLKPQLRADGSSIWTSVLASGMDPQDDVSAEYRWTIHPQLAQALEKLGIC
ncbi:hypothetical protein HJB90_14310 [Rhizobium sp. NLR10a]|uniref:hypothetical protein n=1 Tax=Rhizobium sp. NLR10a TaxID=2731105 RepID=UPI001C830F31|nr:hypothetical protein [Rhizobium sp. NLR10a]MBX5282163.1 hypothetical protein [Rhizobium sp. NLR10a]